MSKKASGFTEAERLSLEWSKNQKKSLDIYRAPRSDHKEYRSRSPVRRIHRSRTPVRRQHDKRKASASGRESPTYSPYRGNRSSPSPEFTTNTSYGRRQARSRSRSRSEHVRSRSRSGEKSFGYRNSRKGVKRSSSSSSSDSSTTNKNPSSKWEHDKYSKVSRTESPHRFIDKDYRPPSPEWVSRAGGVAIMRKRKNDP